MSDDMLNVVVAKLALLQQRVAALEHGTYSPRAGRATNADNASNADTIDTVHVDRIVYGSNAAKIGQIGSTTHETLPSGFYNGTPSTDNPMGSNWVHLIHSRHQNIGTPENINDTANQWQFQLLSDFYTQRFFMRSTSPSTFPAWNELFHTGRPQFVAFQSPQMVINGGTLTANYAATFSPANMGASGLVPRAYAIRINNKWASIATTAWMACAASSSDTQGAVNLYPQNTTISIENSGICPADASGNIRVTGGSTAGVAAYCYLLCYGYFL